MEYNNDNESPLHANYKKESTSKLVCCSTQTDPFIGMDQQQRRSSMQSNDGPVRSLLDAIDDMDADGDGNYLDKLSDDIR